jgi:hypothetical protein
MKEALESPTVPKAAGFWSLIDRDGISVRLTISRTIAT